MNFYEFLNPKLSLQLLLKWLFNFLFEGATALNIAAHNGQRDIVILLLKFGAEPSICDNLGRSAVDVAHLAGHEHIRLS